jgi:hypothetical protein
MLSKIITVYTDFSYYLSKKQLLGDLPMYLLKKSSSK